MLSPVSAPHLSIVVLPFTNIGGDPEQEYFVDGVTESLTTDLSRIVGSFCDRPQHCIHIKGKAVHVKQVGRELNIRYVLEGSVQRERSRFGLACSLSMPKPLITSGPSDLISPSPICSICRTNCIKAGPYAR